MLSFSLIAPLLLVAPQGLSLKFQPPLNKPFRYEMVMDMKQEYPGMPPMPMRTIMQMDMTAISRSGNKTTVRSHVSSAKVIVPANSPMAGMKAQMEKSMSGVTTTAVMGTDFKVISGQASVGGATQGMGGMPSLMLPNHPIRVGESWTETIDMGKMMGKSGQGMQMTGKMPMTMRLVSLNGSGASQTATIAMRMSGTANINAGGMKFTTKMQGSGNFVLDVASGMTRNVNYVTDATTNMSGKNMKQHMVMSMRRK